MVSVCMIQALLRSRALPVPECYHPALLLFADKPVHPVGFFPVRLLSGQFRIWLKDDQRQIMVVGVFFRHPVSSHGTAGYDHSIRLVTKEAVQGIFKFSIITEQPGADYQAKECSRTADLSVALLAFGVDGILIYVRAVSGHSLDSSDIRGNIPAGSTIVVSVIMYILLTV